MRRIESCEICIPGGTAGKEHHFVLLLVEKEVVERPQAPVFTVGVRVQIRVVATAIVGMEKNHFVT